MVSASPVSFAQTQGRSDSSGGGSLPAPREASPSGGANAGTVVRPLPPPPVPAGECEALWYDRNALYKANGYCFRTPRGIAAFGNAGCLYDDVEAVPLTPAERSRAVRLLGRERALGCPR